MDQKMNQFHDLRGDMEDFRVELQESLTQKVALASNLIQTYKDDLDELKRSQRTLTEKLDLAQERESSLVAEIDASLKDADYVKTKLETYQLRKQQLEAQRVTLLEEAKELDTMFANKEQELKLQRKKIMRQRQRDNPEVMLYEKLLGLQIDASQVGTLCFRFRNFDQQMMSRSCGLTLDVSGEKFAILESEPKLEPDVQTRLMDILNRHGDLPRFLTELRSSLIAETVRII